MAFLTLEKSDVCTLRSNDDHVPLFMSMNPSGQLDAYTGRIHEEDIYRKLHKGPTFDYVLSLRVQTTMVLNWTTAIRCSLFSTFYNFSPSVTLRISQFRHVYTI